MNKNYIILLALILGAGTLNAQSLKRFKSKATEAHLAKDYSRALEYYQIIINDAEDETIENYYNAAEAAREFRIYNLSEKYYRQVLMDTSAYNNYNLTNFHLGTVLKYQGKYDTAKMYFQKFLEQDKTSISESYLAKANKEISDCEWAVTLEEDGHEVTQLDSTVNTPNSEFSPVLLGDKLYFSSVRFSTDKAHLPEAPLTRIYISENDKLAEQISPDFNEDLMHSGHATFNEDASRIYYTMCTSVNATEVKCKIYYRQLNGDKWGERVMLSDQINTENYTATQPNIGIDKASGQEILFFVSDRLLDASDSERDLNIWYSYREGDGFGEPVYLSDINTIEDDVTPFFDNKSQTLYFSSAGLQNMGGFDVYATKKKADGWDVPKHMGAPINSSYDDLYYSVNAEKRMSYLSSNRVGSTCDSENELCTGCNDIYKIPQLKLDIRVLTFNAITKEPLNGTTVVLEDLTSSIAEDPQTDLNGNQYDFTGKFDLNYSTNAILEGYVPDDSLFNTINAPSGGVIEIPLYLTPMVDLDALTFSKASLLPITGVKVELIEVEEDDLFIEETSLGIQEDRAKSLYNYDLNYGKNYMVVGSKFGYSRDTFYTTTKGIPVVPAHLFDSLFLCKQPPLTKLYFYNDEPGRNTRNPNTDLSYVDAYKSLTSNEIKGEFTRELASEIEEAGKSLKFFEDVDYGMAMLDSFTNLLLNDPTYLSDENARVIVRGFASPRAKNDYNKKLTCRRIKSIENYFRSKGLLQKYPGQIIFIPDSNGEEKADKSVADEKQGAKKSIFYASASRERRVEILWLLSAPDACKQEEPEDEYQDNCSWSTPVYSPPATNNNN